MKNYFFLKTILIPLLAGIAHANDTGPTKTIPIYASAWDQYNLSDECYLPYREAEQEADQKAKKECGGSATRVSDFVYQVYCKRVSTGGLPSETTVGEVQVRAWYNCNSSCKDCQQ